MVKLDIFYPLFHRRYFTGVLMLYLTTKDVAAECEVTIRTVERWRESGYFEPDVRTPGGHSRYSKEQVWKLKQKRQLEAMMS